MRRDQHKEYGSASAYANAVREWQNKTLAWLQTNHDIYENGFGFQAVQQLEVTDAPGVNNNAAPAEQLQDVLHRERYKVPSFWRRMVAELIDFVMIFFFKVVAMYVIMQMGWVDTDMIESMLVAKTSVHMLMDFTEGFMPFEFASKIMSCVLEAFCIEYGFFACPPGTTPGKLFLDIKVIHVSDVTSATPDGDEVFVKRYERVGFARALGRSAIKCVANNFAFPVNVFCYTFPYNRSFHDCQTQTIVVHSDPLELDR